MSQLLLKEKHLEVKIAEDQLELERTFSLRYEVFNKELGEGLPQSAETQKDKDEYDDYCDHLIVIDKANEDKVVGTYRLLRSSVAKKYIGFYSENEFDLRKIYDLNDEVAELGRSCVHPEYRDGSVITLLWGGLAKYIFKYNIRYFMGCGSFHTNDANVISKAYAYFREKNYIVDDSLKVKPHPHKKLEGFDPNLQVENIKEVQKLVPPLIIGYLRAGSKIGGEPAYDEIFGTTDFFIFFDSHKISERYGQRYLQKN